MKDVAARSVVSESTVSHVLNSTKYVSPEVRERVLAAMAELNFHGNAHARRLARGHGDFLGLIVSDIENLFLPGVAVMTLRIEASLRDMLEANGVGRVFLDGENEVESVC